MVHRNSINIYDQIKNLAIKNILTHAQIQSSKHKFDHAHTQIQSHTHTHTHRYGAKI